jgi:hypothetical protein
MRDSFCAVHEFRVSSSPIKFMFVQLKNFKQIFRHVLALLAVIGIHICTQKLIKSGKRGAVLVVHVQGMRVVAGR